MYTLISKNLGSDFLNGLIINQMVGDRKFDVNGAKALKVTSVAVSYGYAPEGELEACGPDYLVDTVEELGEILGQE